jgi:hypothetical protein
LPTPMLEGAAAVPPGVAGSGVMGRDRLRSYIYALG